MIGADKTLRQFSGYSMKRAFNAIQADVNATLKPFRLRMVTFSALVIIVDRPGLRQAQLAEVLSIERPNAVLIVDELESLEFITREREPDDRRAYSLTATLAGLRVLDNALDAVRKHEERMTAGMSESQRHSLIAALMRVEENGMDAMSKADIGGR